MFREVNFSAVKILKAVIFQKTKIIEEEKRKNYVGEFIELMELSASLQQITHDLFSRRFSRLSLIGAH